MNKKNYTAPYWNELMGNIKLVCTFIWYYRNPNRFFARQNINPVL